MRASDILGGVSILYLEYNWSDYFNLQASKYMKAWKHENTFFDILWSVSLISTMRESWMCLLSALVPWQGVKVDAAGMKLNIKKTSESFFGEFIDWLKLLKSCIIGQNAMIQ